MSLMNFTCYDCEEFLSDNVLFPVSLAPNKPIFNVGDTIYLRVDENSLLSLENNNMTYDNSSNSFLFNLSIYELKNNKEEGFEAREKFNFISLTGNASVFNPNYNYINLSTICNAEKCLIEVGLIPSEKGNFLFILESSYIESTDGCESIYLIPEKFELEGSKNVDLLTDLNINQLKIGYNTYQDLESRENFYFFSVQ